MKNKFLLLTAATLCFAVAPAFANTVNFSGDTTTSGNTYNRSTEAPFDLSTVGDAVPYYSYNFSVTSAGDFNFSAVAVDGFSFDTFIHLYSGSFNPLSALDNLIAANDDAVPGSFELGSAVNNLHLATGNYVFVIDGFGNFDGGEFNASIASANGTVPDASSTLSLASFGFAALLLVRRSKGFNIANV